MTFHELSFGKIVVFSILSIWFSKFLFWSIHIKINWPVLSPVCQCCLEQKVRLGRAQQNWGWFMALGVPHKNGTVTSVTRTDKLRWGDKFQRTVGDLKSASWVMFIPTYIAKGSNIASHERISCPTEVERLTLFSKRELVSFYKAENFPKIIQTWELMPRCFDHLSVMGIAFTEVWARLLALPRRAALFQHPEWNSHSKLVAFRISWINYRTD